MPSSACRRRSASLGVTGAPQGGRGWPAVAASAWRDAQLLERLDPLLEQDAVVHGLNRVQTVDEAAEQDRLEQSGLGLAIDPNQLDADAADVGEGLLGGVVEFRGKFSHFHLAKGCLKHLTALPFLCQSA